MIAVFKSQNVFLIEKSAVRRKIIQGRSSIQFKGEERPFFIAMTGDSSSYEGALAFLYTLPREKKKHSYFR